MHPQTLKKVDELKEGLVENGINPERLAFYKVYIPYFRGLAQHFEEFEGKMRCLGK
jgi:heterodisulfide reductase subunit A